MAANQADEVVALNANGRIIARLGEFQGIRNDGAPNGLLFPAGPVIVGDEMFVTNLALPLTPRFFFFSERREYIVRSLVHGLEQATISDGKAAKEKAARLPVFPIVTVT